MVIGVFLCADFFNGRRTKRAVMNNIVWEIKNCKLLPQPISNVELKKDKKGNLFARVNGKGKWKKAALDTQTLTLFINL